MFLLKMTEGKKAYTVAILLAVFAITGFLTGNLEPARVVELVLEALGIAVIRHAISRK